MDTLKAIQKNMATKDDIITIKTGNDKLQKDVEEIKQNFIQKNSDLEETVETLSQKLNASLNANRAKNILIFKAEEKPDGENIYLKIKEIFDQVGIIMNQFCIEAAYRVGKPGRNRPILIRFIAPRWKALVFQKLKEFNATGI